MPSDVLTMMASKLSTFTENTKSFVKAVSFHNITRDDVSKYSKLNRQMYCDIQYM